MVGRNVGFAFLAVLTIMIIPTPAAHAAPCESLKSLSLENATITLAQSVGAGEFSLPATGRGASTSVSPLSKTRRTRFLQRNSQ
jgi:hypothetical protein